MSHHNLPSGDQNNTNDISSTLTPSSSTTSLPLISLLPHRSTKPICLSDGVSRPSLRTSILSDTSSTTFKQSPTSASLVLPTPHKIHNLDTSIRNRLYPLYSLETPDYLKEFYFSRGSQKFRYHENGSTVRIEAAESPLNFVTSSSHQTVPLSHLPASSSSVPSTTVNLLKRSSSPTLLAADVRNSASFYVLEQNSHKRRQQDHPPVAGAAFAKPTTAPLECSDNEREIPVEEAAEDGSPVPLPSPANSSSGEEDDLQYSSQQTLQSFSKVISSYESLPSEIQRALLAKLLSVTDRSSLSMMAGNIVPSLRCDFLTLLPIELVHDILKLFDFKTLCAASQVSRAWRNIVDSSETIWKNRLIEDEFTIDEEEVRRAQTQEWDYTSWGNVKAKKIKKKFNDVNAPPINIYKAIYRRKYLIINRNWMESNYKPHPLTIEGNGNDVVTCLQFDDEKIITGSDDHSITVYDSQTGRRRNKLEGHDGGVWALQYVGNSLVSGSTDRSVRVWDIKRGKCTHCFTGHTSTVRCLEVLLPVKVGVDPATNAPIMAPRFPVIITGSRDATLRVWKLPPEVPDHITDEQLDAAGPDNGGAYFLRSLQGHASSVRALSGHGNTVVSGSYDTTVRVWNIDTGECRWVLTGHAQRVYSAVLDYKRNRCISGSMDWFVKVWSLETGTLLYTLEGHTSLVGLLDLNRTTLVSAAADSTLRVWDPDNGNFLHKLEGHQGAITCFQHDEYKVVSGSERTLKLWNIRTGKLVQDLLDGLTRIWQVRFDQRRCVAAVQRNDRTFIEVLDFDYDPYEMDEYEEEEDEESLNMDEGGADVVMS